MKGSRRLFPLLASVLVVGGLIWLCSAIFTGLSLGDWDWTRPWKFRKMLLNGWYSSIIISFGALIGSSLVGILLLFGQRCGAPIVRWCCRIFLEFVRETPLLVQLLVGYFVIFAPLLSRTFEAWGWNDKLAIGILLLSLFEGAYLGEILRGGIDSIPRAQWDAARAVGFTPWQIQRHVIFPQAIRRVLPALAGQFVSLIKDSSLLSVIGIQEFTYQANAYSAQTYGGLEAYIPLAIGYLILTAPVAFLSSRLERRFRHET